MSDTPQQPALADDSTEQAQPDAAPRRLRDHLAQPRISPVQLFIIGLGGPAFIATLTWLLDPGMPLSTLLLESVDSGWFGPMMFLLVFTVVAAVGEFRQMRRARYVLRGSSMLIGIAATRARHYENEGRGNAWDMAMHDVSNYLHRHVSREILATWETAVFEWYRTHPAAAKLPHPPAALHEDLS